MRHPRKHLLIGLFLLSLLLHVSGQPALQSQSGNVTALIRSIAAAGRWNDLRWPNFSDYRSDVSRFYQPSYAPAWLDKGQPTSEALAIIQVLQQAEQEGLNPEDYDGSRWDERVRTLQGQGTPEAEANFDAALTVSVMRYVSDLRIGRVNPRHLDFDYDVGPKKLDLPNFVRERLVTASDPKNALAEVEPPFAGYKATRAALRRYIQLSRQQEAEKLPTLEVPVLLPGARSDAMPRLVRFLKLVGDLPEDSPITGEDQDYSDAIVAAVKQFQNRHDLPGNGWISRETVDQMNTPLSARVEQLQLSLERWRWLPLKYAEPPIVVNLPEFYLRVVAAQGKIVLRMHVNVGDSYEHQTPVFEKMMTYLVFRPYWDMPMSIQKKEFVDAIAKDRSFVEQNNFEVVDRVGRVVPGGKISDTELQGLRSGTLRLRQKPGPLNALGLVKFIFPNDHSVYLHDNPEDVDLFSESRGDVSHGCIHVGQPAELAAWVLRGDPKWTLERVENAMHEGKDNLRVNLPKPIPVLIVYATAVVEEDGLVYFTPDLYGHDARLKAALAKGYPYPW